MHGLSVRWSLAGVPDRVADELAAYVESTSHARFTGMDGLRFKVWRMRRGEWFEGTYLFSSREARAAFEEEFLAGVAEAPGTRIVGAPPVLVEAWEHVATAEGWDGFAPTARGER